MTQRLQGIAVMPGLGLGYAVVLKSAPLQEINRRILASDIDGELTKFKEAVDAACRQLEGIKEEAARRAGEEESAIFEAQLLMLQDPSLAESVELKIKQDLLCAVTACRLACEENAAILRSLQDEYFAARAHDVMDISRRLAGCLTGNPLQSTADLPERSVLVTDDLSPSEVITLNPETIRAVVMADGGTTSHAAILLKAIGIPTVMGLGQQIEGIASGDLVFVDANIGEITVNADDETTVELKARFAKFREEKTVLASLKDLPAETLDGTIIELLANIGGAEEISFANDAGAEGVGLFRTEFLFINRPAAPSEDAQYEAYKKVLAAMHPRPITIRTLDAGGDKPIPYLTIPDEENPFLGVRAIRLCLQEEKLFRTQLRALLRASVHGNLQIMFPMIATIDELRKAKAILRGVEEELRAQGHEVASNIPLGIMIEIPAAALAAHVFAQECQFFSIGTNDLVQYTNAADRGNRSLGYLNDPLSPGVLQLIANTIKQGHKFGIKVGMCGEMAGMPEAIPLLVGMGIDELSMASSVLPKAKSVIRSLDTRKAALLWKTVQKMASSREIREYLKSQ